MNGDKLLNILLGCTIVLAVAALGTYIGVALYVLARAPV